MEYSIKASLINNFIQFIEWPKDAFPDAGDNLNICIVGSDPFGEKLDEIAREKKIKDKKYVFKRLSSPGEIENCHVVYTGSSKISNLEKIQKKPGKAPSFLFPRFPVSRKKMSGSILFTIKAESGLNATRKPCGKRA